MEDAVAKSGRFWPWAFLWAILFALAHTQSPEYFSNQHHYFLHGMAQAGEGTLSEDWLANTKDPTPRFTQLVAYGQTHGGQIVFHAIFFLLLGIYFESVRVLIGSLPGFPSHGSGRIVFMTLFMGAHAAILRVASVRLTGVDYPWFLQSGLAAQYVLGPALQPSVFGILLLTSLAAHLRNRPIIACVLAAAPCVMHTTYLIPAGLMTIGYMVVAFREGRVLRGFIGGTLAFAMVVPVIGYTYFNFTIDNHDRFLESQRILAEVRIPHHTNISHWLDPVAGIQIAMMFFAIYLVRKTRLFPILALVTSACVAITGVQLIAESHTLALMFPWRFSVVLMPIATAVILGKVANLANTHGWGAKSSLLAGTAALMMAIGGIVTMHYRLGYFTNDAELPLLQHIHDHKKARDLYLIPVKFPTIKKESPSSQSKTFAPPVRTGGVGIPVDLQRFRLSTGAPIYIDFKAPPYQPDEVFEWQRRIKDCERWYVQRNWDDPETWREVRLAGITHVVVAADKDIQCTAFELVFGDESYKLYRIRTD